MNSPLFGVGSTALRATRLLTTGAMVAALSLIAGFAGIGAYIAMAFAIPVLALVLWNWRWINLQDRTFPGLILLAHAILAAALVTGRRQHVALDMTSSGASASD